MVPLFFFHSSRVYLIRSWQNRCVLGSNLQFGNSKMKKKDFLLQKRLHNSKKSSTFAEIFDTARLQK